MQILKYFKKGAKEFASEWKNDEWWQYRVPSLIIRAIYAIFRKKNSGIFVIKEDWDNLLILDACSFELFKKVNVIPGNLDKKISRGSHTWMFLKENFAHRQFFDTIYISSNPFIWDLKNNFFLIVYVDSELPEILMDYALKISDRYPEKRLIVHFLQPHHPFIGETKIDEADRTGKNPYYLFAKGVVKEEKIRKAYEDNLKRVLPSVSKLVEFLPGKTVISADHGEAFGAKIPFWPVKIYGHSGPRIKELIEVPWLGIDYLSRKKIISAKAGIKPVLISEKDIMDDINQFKYF